LVGFGEVSPELLVDFLDDSRQFDFVISF